MLNILFVDDEPNLLSGLRRMLHSMRDEWNMSFAPGGPEALEFLESNPVDVVVSDMKMPGMDGAALLHEIREKYPQTVRMVLSGFAESEMIVRSVTEAHQYMSKPCDAERLKATVERAKTLHEMMTSERLRLLLTQLRTVPSIPTLYTELMEEIGKPDPSIKVVSSIVESDIGMTVKILQIVNSAFFSLQRTVSDANQAVRLLGLDTISSLALALGVFAKFDDGSVDRKELDRLWNHSMGVATLAKKITALENREMADDAYTAGLLHDVGQLVLTVNLPDEHKAVKAMVEEQNVSQLEAETVVVGANHAEIGAYLLSLWGLPRPIVEAAAFHHNPAFYQPGEFTCLAAVHAANAIHASGGDMESFEMLVDDEYCKQLGLDDKFEDWFAEYFRVEEEVCV